MYPGGEAPARVLLGRFAALLRELRAMDAAEGRAPWRGFGGAAAAADADDTGSGGGAGGGGGDSDEDSEGGPPESLVGLVEWGGQCAASLPEHDALCGAALLAGTCERRGGGGHDDATGSAAAAAAAAAASAAGAAAELEQMVLDVQAVLSAEARPGVVTIARSAEDAFTPPASVEARQQRVLRMLEALYGPLSVRRVYAEDEYMA